MKLVTTTDNLENRFGMKKAIDILCDAGYDDIDFSAFHPRFYTDALNDAFFTEMRKYALDKGLTFEADNFMANLPGELCPSAAKFMADTGRYLVGKFEEYNK